MTGQASRRLEELSSEAESAKEQLNKTQRQLDAVRTELRTKALEVHVCQRCGLQVSLMSLRQRTTSRLHVHAQG